MRRFLALIAIPLLACLVLAGCGGSSKSTASPSSSSSSSSSAPNSSPPNSAAPPTRSFRPQPNVPVPKATDGHAPTLTFSSASPPSGLVTKTVIKGNGPKITKGDLVVAQYVGYIWRTKKPFVAGSSSWSLGSPLGFVVDASPEQVIPGWDKA